MFVFVYVCAQECAHVCVNDTHTQTEIYICIYVYFQKLIYTYILIDTYIYMLCICPLYILQWQTYMNICAFTHIHNTCTHIYLYNVYVHWAYIQWHTYKHKYKYMCFLSFNIYLFYNLNTVSPPSFFSSHFPIPSLCPHCVSTPPSFIFRKGHTSNRYEKHKAY